MCLRTIPPISFHENTKYDVTDNRPMIAEWIGRSMLTKLSCGDMNGLWLLTLHLSLISFLSHDIGSLPGYHRYVDRGIIPRALSLLFAEFKERSDQQFTCHISYLEIYNEQVRMRTRGSSGEGRIDEE